MKKRLAMGLLVLMLFATAFAETALAAGTTGATFLQLGIGARPEGMGGAGVALADDANALHINTAGMVQISNQQVTLMHNEWLLDTKQEYISYVTRRGDQAFGGSLVYMDFGSQLGYTASNTFTGAFRPISYAMMIATSRKLSNDLSVGLGLEYIKEKIADANGSAWALDAGALYTPKGSPFRYGLALQNFGTKIKLGTTADRLPLTLRAGVAYHVPKKPLTIAADWYGIRHDKPEFHAGAEYIIANMVALRAGYNSANDLDKKYTFGVGFSHQNYALDYAFVPMGVFGDSHRFSFTANF
jgi:hypothetical protein